MSSTVLSAVLENLDNFDVKPDRSGQKRSYHYRYWRKPDGYIVPGPGWPTEVDRQIDKGFVSLKKWGEFLETNEYVMPSGRRITWSVNTDPYFLILHAGGASEFTLEQIAEFGWHRKPPYPGIVFPQLAGVEIEEFKCQFCPKLLLNKTDRSRHERIAHQDISGQTELARLMATANQELTGPLGAAIKLLAQGQMTQSEQLRETNERLALAIETLAGKRGPGRPRKEESIDDDAA